MIFAHCTKFTHTISQNESRAFFLVGNETVECSIDNNARKTERRWRTVFKLVQAVNSITYYMNTSVRDRQVRALFTNNATVKFMFCLQIAHLLKVRRTLHKELYAFLYCTKPLTSNLDKCIKLLHII